VNNIDDIFMSPIKSPALPLTRSPLSGAGESGSAGMTDSVIDLTGGALSLVGGKGMVGGTVLVKRTPPPRKAKLNNKSLGD
jgi:hypothetical protein